MVDARQDRQSIITAHLATYILVRRKELGLSLDNVATRAGCSKAHLWALERRQSKNPTLWLLMALCEALQCSLNSLIGVDVSQPMFTQSEMALIDAHRRIFAPSSHLVGIEPTEDMLLAGEEAYHSAPKDEDGCTAMATAFNAMLRLANPPHQEREEDE